MFRLKWFFLFFLMTTVLFSQNGFAEDAGFYLKEDSSGGLGVPTLKNIRLILPSDLGHVSFFGRNRTRYEAWDYFRSTTDNHYDLFANQLRLGTKWIHELFNVNATWQYTQLFNVPTHTSAGAGSGALYYSNSLRRDPHGMFMKYLNIEIKNPLRLGPMRMLKIPPAYNLVTLGRFNYSSGNEMKSDDKKIDWLKSQRIGDRLIGSFEWSHYGRSFDGAKAVYGNKLAQVEVAGFSPTQGGFEEMGQRHIQDIGIIAVEANLKKDQLIPGMEEQFFYYGYDDHRVIAATTTRFDNTARTIRAGSESDIEMHTFGGHMVGDYKVGPGVWDILGWAAVQTGTWYDLDQHAYAFAVETGYQWNELPWKPWLRGGINYGSGDDNSTDGKHGTFFQMLPTSRIYSSSVLYNMMNTEDIFVSLILKPRDNLTLRPEYHHVNLAEKNDRWYVGSGAMHTNISDDYAVRSSNGASDLGHLVDMGVSWAINPDMTLSGYYGHFFGEDVIRRFYAKRQANDLGYVELVVNF